MTDLLIGTSRHGLTLGEWLDGYRCWLAMKWCGLRGHPWGPWLYDAPDFTYGPATRMCTRCDAYEQRRTR